MEFVAAKLAGRCASGLELGQGSLIHALKDPAGYPLEIFGKSLCNARPGRRSVGWTPVPGRQITCKRCLKKMEVKS